MVLDCERVGTDQERREHIFDDRLCRARAKWGVALTPADGAVVGGYLDQAALSLWRVGADVQIADIGQGAATDRLDGAEPCAGDVVLVANDDKRLDRSNTRVEV